MTRIIGNTKGPPTVLIEREEQDTCQQCGKLDELRPYGPGGKRICFDCAMSDRAGTEKRMAALWGEDNHN